MDPEAPSNSLVIPQNYSIVGTYYLDGFQAAATVIKCVDKRPPSPFFPEAWTDEPRLDCKRARRN
jgi:hypothetical protein